MEQNLCNRMDLSIVVNQWWAFDWWRELDWRRKHNFGRKPNLSRGGNVIVIVVTQGNMTGVCDHGYIDARGSSGSFSGCCGFDHVTSCHAVTGEFVVQ